MKYSEYLQSKEWMRLANMRRQRDGDKCQRCGCKTELDVHHLTYERLGNERLSDLITLCRRCHMDEHYESRFEIMDAQDLVKYQPVTEKQFTNHDNVRGFTDRQKVGV